MNVTPGRLAGVQLLTPRVFADDRGWFKETYQGPRYATLGIGDLPQHNVSASRKGVIRGLHFQCGAYAQGKLVQVLRGAVWDVVVDMREDSPTHGQWESFEVTAENHLQVWIPAGFAHGFQALEDDTVFHYACTALYNPQAEAAVHVFSPRLALPWPLRDAAIVNAKDLAAPEFSR